MGGRLFYTFAVVLSTLASTRHCLLECGKALLNYYYYFYFFTLRYYCQQEGLPEPEALCFPGYYCNGSAKVPNPPYANCPIGHYCVEGSYVPEPCPRGSFANSERNKNVTDCKPCSPGYYCDPSADIVQESPCDAGFVCILGKMLDFRTLC